MVVRSSCSGRSSLRPFRGYRPVGGLACAPPRPRIARSGGRASGGQRRVPGRASGASPPGPAHDHGQHARGAGPESNPVRVDGGPRSRYNDRQAIRHRDPLAQSVEHLTFNQGVAGSIPAGLTNEIKAFRPCHRIRAGRGRNAIRPVADAASCHPTQHDYEARLRPQRPPAIAHHPGPWAWSGVAAALVRLGLAQTTEKSSLARAVPGLRRANSWAALAPVPSLS